MTDGKKLKLTKDNFLSENDIIELMEMMIEESIVNKFVELNDDSVFKFKLFLTGGPGDFGLVINVFILTIIGNSQIRLSYTFC
jgi:hypothetical protein